MVVGTFECDYVLRVTKLGEKLHKPHLDVMLTREDDTFVSLRERCRDANARKADLLVSLHTNFATSSAQGYEVFTSRGTTRADKPALKLASRHIETFPAQRNRGIKEANFYMLKHTVMPAPLVELGFFSNIDEVTWLTMDETKAKLAEALASGILDFCGITQTDQPALTLEQRVARIEDHLRL